MATSNLASNYKHLDVLDFLRGIASLAVVLVHYGGLGFLGDGILTKIFYQGTYGVHLFFVISGMVIPLSLFNSNYTLTHKDFLKFILKRFIRISLPYYVAVLLICIQHQLTGYDGPHAKFEIMRLVHHFTYTIPFSNYTFFDPVFWSLSIEFQFYILIALLYPLFVTRNKMLALVIYMLSLASCLPVFKNSNFLVFHYSPLFTVGVLLFLSHAELLPKFHLYLLSFGAFSLCYFHLGLAIMLAGLIGFMFIHFFPFKNKVTGFLGTISYSVYLTHNFFRLFYFVFIAHFAPELTLSLKFLFLVCVVGLTILFASLFYKFIEKPSVQLTAFVNKLPWFAKSNRAK